ncbi:DgyrCDS13398 [Dimorphilus gyrociliatus]|uniref:Origin recognition complex subunit 4 n=1 Tax=Dimorphilus gyrociliatus TaxID=2664684 RepID=A0A7I8WAJ8_9ANNE|nr:DgyrCDS13398 [Dimorphilus gyrociliatus]
MSRRSRDANLAEKAKSLLLGRLAGQIDHSPHFLCPEGFKHEKNESKVKSAVPACKRIYDSIQKVFSNESSSLILTGIRGIGKSYLIDKVLKRLKDERRQFRLVRLNGCIQSDEVVAKVEIDRQLNEYTNSHPLIIILDEFENFATDKQHLLYNLFDSSTSFNMYGSAVFTIGITTRMNVIELLEKRVRSRFSHEQVHLERDIDNKGFLNKWNDAVKKSFTYGFVREYLQDLYYQQVDIREIVTFSDCCLRLMGYREFFDEDLLREVCSIYTLNSQNCLLQDLTTLELSILIAADRIYSLFVGEPFTFEMVFNEYKKFFSKHSSLEMFAKSVVLKSYEKLFDLEILTIADGSTVNNVPKEYHPMKLTVPHEDIERVVADLIDCPTEVKQWVNSLPTQ